MTERYVYGLADPIETATIRYIGTAHYPSSEMLRSLMSDATKYPVRGELNRWMNTLFQRQTKPVMIVLQYCSSEIELTTAERFWIAHAELLGWQLLTVFGSFEQLLQPAQPVESPILQPAEKPVAQPTEAPVIANKYSYEARRRPNRNSKVAVNLNVKVNEESKKDYYLRFLRNIRVGNVVFPIPEVRPPNAQELVEIHNLIATGEYHSTHGYNKGRVSVTRLAWTVYGNENQNYLDWLRQALNIPRLR